MDFKKLMLAQIVIMTALFDAAQAENREFNEDEQGKYDAAETEHNRLKAAFDTSEKLKALNAGLPAEPAAAAHVPAANAAAAANQLDPDPDAGTNLAADKPYAHLGEMLTDVAGTKNGNALAQERLVKASLNTETGGDGNFLVPDDFIGSLLKKAESESQLFSRTNQLSIKGNTANIPAVDETSRADGQRFGGISVTWLREGGEGNYTQPKFRNLDLKLSKLMGLVSVTDEMLEDSQLLASWVNSAFPAEMAFALDQACYDGDGNGKPLGILNSGALVTVAKESGQAADTVVYENIIKMWARMSATRMARAVWYLTQQVLEQLPLMNLAVGTGGSAVFLPAGGASASPFATLLGRPIVPIEQAPKLGDKGDIMLADMSDYIAIVKGGLKTASSIHVDFDKAKTSFRFIRRVNGAPYTRKALASRANASFLTSPYITLAERT